jgi:hypothetical protein
MSLCKGHVLTLPPWGKRIVCYLEPFPLAYKCTLVYHCLTGSYDLFSAV